MNPNSVLSLRRLHTLPWLVFVFTLPVIYALWVDGPLGPGKSCLVTLSFNSADPRLPSAFAPGQLQSDGRSVQMAVPLATHATPAAALAEVEHVLAARFGNGGVPRILQASAHAASLLDGLKSAAPIATAALVAVFLLAVFGRMAANTTQSHTHPDILEALGKSTAEMNRARNVDVARGAEEIDGLRRAHSGLHGYLVECVKQLEKKIIAVSEKSEASTDSEKEITAVKQDLASLKEFVSKSLDLLQEKSKVEKKLLENTIELGDKTLRSELITLRSELMTSEKALLEDLQDAIKLFQTSKEPVGHLTTWQGEVKDALNRLLPFEPFLADLQKRHEAKNKSYDDCLQQLKTAVEAARSGKHSHRVLTPLHFRNDDTLHAGWETLLTRFAQADGSNRTGLVHVPLTMDSLDSGQKKCLLECVRELSDGKKMVLALKGAPGTGKSVIARVLCGWFQGINPEPLVLTIGPSWDEATLIRELTRLIVECWISGQTRWLILEELSNAAALYDVFGDIQAGVLDCSDPERRTLRIVHRDQVYELPIPPDFRIIVTLNPASPDARERLGDLDGAQWQRRLHLQHVQPIDSQLERRLLQVADGSPLHAAFDAIAEMRAIGDKLDIPELCEGFSLPKDLVNYCRGERKYRRQNLENVLDERIYKKLSRHLERRDPERLKAYLMKHSREDVLDQLMKLP